MPLKTVPLGHEFPTESALLSHAGQLRGARAGAIAEAAGFDRFNEAAEAKGKTGLGHLTERFFGIRQDNESRPDFANLGIELKTLPMKKSNRAWTIKEPTSITMIDYRRLKAETWADAALRKKLAKILWVPYEHDYEDKRNCVFRRPFLWSPPAHDEAVFEEDYDRVRRHAQEGRCHELSETISHWLAARRKGAKGSMTGQPGTEIPAKTRAWALKPTYTRPILTKFVLNKPLISLIEEVPRLKDLHEVEAFVQSALSPVEGKTLREIARDTGARFSGSKDGPARFVRRLLGITGRGPVEEFEKLGLRIQTVWAHQDTLKPWEAVSFPKMVLTEFVDEEWEESTLYDHLDNILFIPLFSKEKKATNERVLGRPFFWSPNEDQWRQIETEWRLYRMLVSEGKARYREIPNKTKSGTRRVNDLPNMTETKCIHMRPHGQVAADVDRDPLGNEVTKQCFWLNKGLLQQILMGQNRTT